MPSFEIKGGKRLEGGVSISGAKNSALPILMTSLLTTETSTYSNVPYLADISTTLSLLGRLGAVSSPQISNHVTIDASTIKSFSAPIDLVKSMRASILVMGPLLAKYGKVKIALPGGCAIGARPVDIHIKGMEALGAKISFEKDYLIATADEGLQGAELILKQASVGATENLLMAATLAKGQTVIRNAAKEPEVVDLANCLIGMGANIGGAGTDCITIEGVSMLKGACHEILPDRIETGTYLVAAAITRGHILVKDTDPKLLESVLSKLTEAGAGIKVGDDWIALNMKGKRPTAVDIATEPYPGFPTDMQAQFMALNSVAVGTSKMTENIFENRFMHVDELKRMGADITIENNHATCKGRESLNSAIVMATDLRASASLVLAGLASNGNTLVKRVNHADRGYERFEEKLLSVGAEISRIPAEKALSA